VDSGKTSVKFQGANFGDFRVPDHDAQLGWSDNRNDLLAVNLLPLKGHSVIPRNEMGFPLDIVGLTRLNLARYRFPMKYSMKKQGLIRFKDIPLILA
jgi:hypothetical protein